MEDEDKRTLLSEIDSAIESVASLKEIAKIKSLSRYDPKRVAQILYLYSVGVSQTQMIRKYGLNRNAIIHALVDYSDHLGQWRQLGGKLAARCFLDLHFLQEDLIEKIQVALDEGTIDATFKALKDVSVAKHLAWQMTIATRVESTDVVEVAKVVTQADYEETLAAAELRLVELRANGPEQQEALSA